MSYFIYLIPDESGATYNSENETVEYSVHLSKLPCDILTWFNILWTQPDPEPYYHSTLGSECPLGLWTIAGEEVEEEDKPNCKFESYASLFEWLNDHIAVEGDIITRSNSIIISSTMEFDWQYAFFDTSAVVNKELSKYLQPLVSLTETGEVVLNKNKIVYSAYLN